MTDIRRFTLLDEQGYDEEFEVRSGPDLHCPYCSKRGTLYTFVDTDNWTGNGDLIIECVCVSCRHQIQFVRIEEPDEGPDSMTALLIDAINAGQGY